MYWAKPYQTYDQHIKQCYETWSKLWTLKEPYIDQWLHQIDMPLREFRIKSLICVLFHDIGKLNPIFQNYMDALRHGRKIEQGHYFRHEINSAIFLMEYWYKRRKSGQDAFFPYEVWAVLGHHKTLERNWTSFDREIKRREWPELTGNRIEYAIEVVTDILKKEGISPPSSQPVVGGNDWKNHFFPRMRGMLDVEHLDLYDYFNPKDKRQIFALMKGILHFSDWLASGYNEKQVFYLEETQEQLITRMEQKAKYDGRDFYLLPFQKKCVGQKGNILAIAPTGSGKTEAALIWALNRPCPRIILLMPTMVTSNGLYSRMVRWYFDDKESGLCHSGAQTYFHLKNVDPVKVRFQLLHNKAFIPPLMVATVDQVLNTGFNTGTWTLKELALSGSSVIIDEIQAYDTFTLGLISETIKKILRLGGRIMIMSATMPRVLREHFISLLPDVSDPIIAEDRMQSSRNEWHYIDQELDELDNLIKSRLDLGLRVAIIVNNIESAKGAYSKWRINYNAMCFHSEFTMADRIEKEKHIDEVQLLIATQIVEVSLDVDFDIMFSECAPFDSLVQRAGRCNRYDDPKKHSQFIVFRASEISRKCVYKKSLAILEKTEQVLTKHAKGKLTEQEIADLLELVYADVEIKDEKYLSASSIYSEIEKREILFDLPFVEEKTRDFDYMKVSIIPIEFFEKVENFIKEGHYALVSLYEVPIGTKKYFALRSNNRYQENIYDLPVFHVSYSSETGIDIGELERDYYSL
ncbi:MAG: CRISPR-associated helicase Cas3' [Syntrophomonadaceae bacterium]|jgi:CRISPR-associated endonuclease/helicase Cas3